MTNARPQSLAALQRSLGARFNDERLLVQALVHRSYLNEQPDRALASYDRLEYLGDAFLGWVAARELYARFPNYGEGELTRARAALARGETLAEAARSLRLGEHLLLGQGEERSGGRDRDRNLAGALEAVTGAMLLDAGEDAARAFTLRWLAPLLEDRAGAERDPKTALQELVQSRGLPLPVYETVADEGKPHAKTFAVRALVDGREAGAGEGRRKAEAEQNAARQALASLSAQR